MIGSALDAVLLRFLQQPGDDLGIGDLAEDPVSVEGKISYRPLVNRLLDCFAASRPRRRENRATQALMPPFRLMK
jgi:hypothetical protein